MEKFEEKKNPELKLEKQAKSKNEQKTSLYLHNLRNDYWTPQISACFG